MRYILFVGYMIISFLYSLYGYFFTFYGYKGFAYNLGRGLVWPFVMFPSLGEIVGGIIILAIIFFGVISQSK